MKATGYVTVAERPLDPADYPDADPDLLVPGRSSSARPRGPVDLDDYRNWWHWVPGAQWRHPEGPGSDLTGRDRHPVTHVAYEDATAYAAWAGKDLPTEAEWEHAARGGLDGAVYTWGDEFAPKGRMMANTWQGEFPWENLRTDRLRGHVAGQVASRPTATACSTWRATSGSGRSDFYTPSHPDGRDPRLLRAQWTAGRTPGSRRRSQSFNLGQPGEKFPRMVVKGGSHLCAPELLPPLPPGGPAAADDRDLAWPISGSAASSARPRPTDPRTGPMARLDLVC